MTDGERIAELERIALLVLSVIHGPYDDPDIKAELAQIRRDVLAYFDAKHLPVTRPPTCVYCGQTPCPYAGQIACPYDKPPDRMCYECGQSPCPYGGDCDK